MVDHFKNIILVLNNNEPIIIKLPYKFQSIRFTKLNDTTITTIKYSFNHGDALQTTLFSFGFAFDVSTCFIRLNSEYYRHYIKNNNINVSIDLNNPNSIETINNYIDYFINY